MSQVVVHNADGAVLCIKSIRHAVGMIVRGVAEPYRWIDGEYFGAYPFLTGVILTPDKYVYPKWRDRAYLSTKQVQYSKEMLRLRDRLTCAYCGGYGDEIEHVVPRGQGGATGWLNCVLACRPCNERKACRTPEQAGMTLLWQPWEPTAADLLR